MIVHEKTILRTGKNLTFYNLLNSLYIKLLKRSLIITKSKVLSRSEQQFSF